MFSCGKWQVFGVRCQRTPGKAQVGNSILENVDIFMLFSILLSKQIWNEGLFHCHLIELNYKLQQYIH